MASSSILTRLSTQHSVFGQPAHLPQRQLPTKEDVFRCYLWHRDNCSADELQSRQETLKLTATDVTGVWNKASIPTIEEKSVLKKLDRLVNAGNKLQKYPLAKRQCASFQSDESSLSSFLTSVRASVYPVGSLTDTSVNVN